MEVWSGWGCWEFCALGYRFLLLLFPIQAYRTCVAFKFSTSALARLCSLVCILAKKRILFCFSLYFLFLGLDQSYGAAFLVYYKYDSLR